jgi:hypothetical protein
VSTLQTFFSAAEAALLWGLTAIPICTPPVYRAFRKASKPFSHEFPRLPGGSGRIEPKSAPHNLEKIP